MPLVSPPIAIERPKSGHGDGSPDYGRRLYRARLALVLGLVSISMLFVTVTAVFVFLRHGAFVLDSRTGSYLRQWVQVALPLRLLLVNTFILLFSSFTIEMSRRRVAREMALAPVRSIPGIALDRERGMPWLAFTITLGFLFLAGQWTAWQYLEARGFHISTRTPTPFFYVLTGAHAVHLAGGIIVLLYAGIISLLHRAVEQRRIVLEIASWYWHFMGVLWIYIFALLQFGR